jgi:hypothetical protein
MRRENLVVEWVAPERVFCSPSNPRRNEEAIEPVAASLRRFGWRQPIVARPSGEVIAGNTRLKAAQRLGFGEVPVVWFEGTDLEATAYQIADNRTHEFSGWDNGALAELLEDLRAEDALEGVGYTSAQIDELLAELGRSTTSPQQVDDPGPEEAPAKPVSRRGDVWLLGEHRLMCGDSTSPEDVALLLADEKPVLFSSDPPYCVNYTGKDRPIHDGKPSGKGATGIEPATFSLGSSRQLIGPLADNRGQWRSEADRRGQRDTRARCGPGPFGAVNRGQSRTCARKAWRRRKP